MCGSINIVRTLKHKGMRHRWRNRGAAWA